MGERILRWVAYGIVAGYLLFVAKFGCDAAKTIMRIEEMMK